MTSLEILIMTLTAALSAVFLVRWRVGVVGALVFGFLMDPIRKLVPGEPLYLSALVIVPIIATLWGAWRSGARLSLRWIFGPGSPLLLPSILFFILVVVQSVNALVQTNSLPIATIGMLAYFAPLTGLVLGYNWPRGTSDISRLFKWYVICTLIMASSIYLVKLGYNGVLLDPVGEGLFVYSSERIRLESGLFRSAEIAAWHMAIGACFLFILSFTRRKSLILSYLYVAIVPMLLGALLFTGRRKALVVIVLFVVVYLVFTILFRRGARRTSVVLGALLLVMLGIVSFTDLGEIGTIEDYYSRSGGLGRGMEVQRVKVTWIDQVGFVVARNGIFGAGAGAGSQGAQYFGGGGAIVGGSAEGGIGKIVAELGIPGLFLIVWLGVAGARQFWATARRATRTGGRRTRYTYGLIAVLIANVFIFTIGHQVFGDPFVLFVLGLLVGAVLVTPFIAEGRVRRVDNAMNGPGTTASGEVDSGIKRYPVRSSARDLHS